MADLGPYRLWLDIQATQNPHSPERGIARYTAELATGLLDVGAPVAALALAPSQPRPSYLDQRLFLSPELRWGTARSFRRAALQGPLIYHVGSPYEHHQTVNDLFPPYAVGGDHLLISTIYDFIPYLYPNVYMREPGRARLFESRAETLRRADMLLAISEHTQRDAIAVLGVDPAKVHVIGGAASDFFRPPTPDEEPIHFLDLLPKITRPFVLTVGGVEWRKNSELLLAAFAAVPERVRKEYQLVIVCNINDDAARAWQAHAHQHGLTDDDFVFTGLIDDRLLRALYQLTTLFVYPSRYEGFGLPVLEAVRCGVPAITSDASSLPEVLDDPAATFAVDDAAALTAAMTAALDDPSHRAHLVEVASRAAAHHTWPRVAHRMLEGCERAITARRKVPGRRRPPKPRLAVVGPLPPTWSGVAEHLARTIPWLQEHFEVTLFYESARPSPLAHPCLPIDQLGRHFDPHSFHARLYAIGNSYFHEHTREKALRYPGVVWLHDINLSGLELHLAREGADDDRARETLRRRLHAVYDDRVVPRALHEPWDGAAYRDTGMWFARELAHRSEHLVVSSRLAKQLVGFDAQPEGPVPPITVIPLGAPSRDELDAVVVPAEPPEPNVLVALGIVDLVKLPHVLISALSQLHHKDARVRFVGLCPPDVRAHLDRVSRSLGVQDRVEYTGRVDEAAYVANIIDATVVVQLRGSSNGESSAAVLDALTVGRPIITNMPGCADLPASAVEVLPVRVSADQLATAIDGWLDDYHRRLGAHTSGRTASAQWTSREVARALVDVLLSTI